MPLFSTTALWLLHRAVVESSGPRLVASGAAFGLALQNHLTVLAIAPGMALYFLWKGRPLIWPWLLLAGLGMLLAVANLLIFNLMTRFSGLSFAATRSGAYVAGETFDLGAWAGRLLLLLRTGGAALGGLVSESAQPEALFHPLVALYAVLALVGFVLLCRRGEWLPLLALVSGLLLISLLNGRLEPLVVRARYSAPLLPLGCVAVAVSLVDLHQQARQTSQRLRIAPTRVADLAGLFLALPLVFGPLFLLHGYYEDAHRRGRTNRPILATLEAISRAGPSGEWVCVDRALNDRRTLPSGRLLEIMEWALPLRGRQVRVVYVQGDGQSSGLSLEDCGVLVLDPNSVELVASYHELEPLPGEPGRQAPLRAFRFR
jgi:hypothetical protein